jgi:hypothetical protein
MEAALFLSPGKGSPKLVDSLDRSILSLDTSEKIYYDMHVRIDQSKGSNRKTAIEKLTTGLKNKTWSNPQIKNQEKETRTPTD